MTSRKAGGAAAGDPTGVARAPGGELACPAAAIAALAACREPYLIGIRHHSPALSVALPELLERAKPDVLAIELPVEAAEWLEWLTDPAATAPLALAFSAGDGLSFYPFADFSPELVALRWARERGVPVRCVDLAIAHQPTGADLSETDQAGEDLGEAGQGEAEAGGAGPGEEGLWVSALAGAARAEVGDLNETWDRLVEAPAVGSSSEQIRRAALAHGWASRQAEAAIDTLTAAREAAMRSGIEEELAAGRRVAAVIGAFHAPALAGLGAAGVRMAAEAEDPNLASREGAVVSGCVVGYTFAQLDSRSGYPAGIRDPGWQQEVLQAAGNPAQLAAAATRLITEITRQLRAAGHPAGPGEAAETARLALDLAALRGLAAPSRRELIEATTSVLAHGEVLGRGRAVAAALESVLIGQRTGRVAPGTPVSALRANLIGELESLGLLAEAGSAEVSVEPLRGPQDLARHVLLQRLVVARISYAAPAQARVWRGADTVASTWQLHWSAATDASVELAAARGLTAAQIATTELLTREPSSYAEVVSLLRDAADCGSPPATRWALDLAAELVAGSDFVRSVQLSALLDDIASQRLPGSKLLPLATRERAGELGTEFTAAAVRELAGVAGSDRLEDASALAAFASQARDRELGVRHRLTSILETGSPLMQGAALGLLLWPDAEPPEQDPESPGLDFGLGAGPDAGPNSGERACPELAALLTSWLYTASAEQRHHLRRRLAGLLTTTGGFDASPAWLAFTEQVNLIEDAHFVSVLPALRGGCDVLDGEARSELLHDLARQFGPATALALPAEETVAVARYDEAARERLAALGLADLHFSPAERWRLILGQERQGLSTSGRRLASALDELYGRPARDALDPGMRGASSGPSQLGVREWAGEIEALFGDVTLDEVFGQAASDGRADVLSMLNPAQVRPSVELLTTALSLTGALPEVRLAKLRPLVAALIAGVSAELAVQLRPALAGLNTSRPTRRRTARLNLPRTIRANLRHAVVQEGRAQIVPANPVFSERARREADWHLIVVVDVSGSMSESVVFSALTAAVLAGVRCLEVTFLAFSTEVIDFSGYVDDPLTLLLEVDVGGGTDIAGAMRAARSRVRVSERTLCVLISDFDEYGSLAPLLGEVSELHAAGVKLMGCAALSDSGSAVYNVGVAGQVAAAGMRVAALSPLDLARWVGEVIRG